MVGPDIGRAHVGPATNRVLARGGRGRRAGPLHLARGPAALRGRNGAGLYARSRRGPAGAPRARTARRNHPDPRLVLTFVLALVVFIPLAVHQLAGSGAKLPAYVERLQALV